MLTGACLCGAIRFKLTGPIEVINCCHCSRCRQRTGSAFATIAHANLDHFEYTAGEDLIESFTPDEWNVRRFCRICGSPLPGTNEEDKEVGIPVGLLDQDPGVRPSLHIMVESKAPWYDIAGDETQYETFPEDW